MNILSKHQKDIIIYNSLIKMPSNQYRVGITVNKKLYELLKERSREEITTMSKAAKYFLLEGLKAKGYENIQEYSE